MSFEKYQYKILCEDRKHYDFVRKVLEIKGANTRRITLYDKLPEGKSCGSKWVDDNIDTAVQKLTAIYPKTVLVIVRDVDKADYETLKKKYSQYKTDNVFIVLPKRNIESWLYYFQNQNITDTFDENEDKKLKMKNVKITDCAEKCCKILSQQPQSIPPSLKDTIERLNARIQTERGK